MKYIFLWDIYGKTWRNTVKRLLPKYIKKFTPDYVFANSENLSHWKWIRINLLDELQKAWINAFTWWNHIFSNKEIYEEFKKNKRQLRPANFPDQVAWTWYLLIDNSVLLINVMWNVFMKDNLNCPFESVNNIIKQFKNYENLEVILDIHAEASSEKRALAEFLDWKVSMIVWTHTHVQTNDDKILKWWTGFITDLWMCGPTNSILWVKTAIIVKTMITQVKDKFDPAEWPWEFAWIFFEINHWKCINIEKIYEIEK